jgi:hypothetical protein
MQRCALEGGHPGEHLGVSDPTGGRRFRWDEKGIRLAAAEMRNYGQWGEGSRPAAGNAATSAVPTGESHLPLITAGRHATEATVSVEDSITRSPTRALWALTAVLERLTEVILTASDSANSTARGSHSADVNGRSRT